jgi:hypothetical protein
LSRAIFDTMSKEQRVHHAIVLHEPLAPELRSAIP